jgi:WD40 repeat protein
VLLDASVKVTTVSLGGGPDVVPQTTRNSFAAVSKDGQVLLRMRWSEDPYVPLLKSWLITAVDRQTGTDRGVIAETTNQLALSPDGATMVTGGGHKLRLWRTADGREVMRIASRMSVERLMVSPEARYIATWDSAGAVDIWDVAHVSELLRVPTGRVTATSADGKRVAIGTPLGVVVVDQVTGRTVAAIPLVGGAGFVALSADGRYLVASGGDPRGFNFRPDLLRTLVLDLTRGADTVFAGSRTTAAAFDSTGAALVLGTSDSVVRLIELAGRKVRWTKRYDGGHATRILFSADGRTVGVALEPPLRSTAVVVAVNSQSGAELARRDNRETNALALSPDGTEIATATSGVVEVSAVRDGRVTLRLRHPATLETIRQIAFLPGDRLMTVAGSIASAFMGTPFFTEQAVFVWNRTSGAVEYRLPDVADRAKDYAATLGEEDKPYFADVIWSPSGAEIGATVFASRLSYWTVPADLAPRDVRIWRLGATRPEEVYRAGMDDDSRLVGLDDRAGLVFTAGRSLRAWSYRAPALVAETCRRITRQLSAAEWRALVSPDERPRATCR